MKKSRVYYSSSRKSVLYVLLAKGVDFFVDFFSILSKKRFRGPSNDPLIKRIILISFGHLGDALILSYVVPIIKKQYPNSKVDVMAGDWCVPIFKSNPLIDNIIVVNHFFTNRSNISFLNKIYIHLKTSLNAFRKLKKGNYDYSIDIRYTTATSHYLTGIAPIKKTIGYGSAAFGGLLDAELLLPDRDLHLIQIIASLLLKAGITISIDDVAPYFNVSTDIDQTQHKFFELNLKQDQYVMMFPETGEPLRALTPDFWIKLIELVCLQTSYKVIICGQLESTKEWCKGTNIKYHDNIIIKTAGLNMSDLVLLASNAEMAFTLESFPAHLCSIFTNTVSFFKDGAGYTYFPIAKFPSVIIHNDEQSVDKASLPNLTTIYCSEIENIKTLEIVETLINTNVH